MTPIKLCLILIMLILVKTAALAQDSLKTIHVFVALCDNKNQGIVPVPEKIGNGQDPFNNLYWGAGYGVKTFFDKKSEDWILKKTVKNPEKGILERIIFKHAKKNIWLLADAYDGAKIKECITDFLLASSGNLVVQTIVDSLTLNFGGASSLLAYTGHDGLMDFDLELTLKPADDKKREGIILACFSKSYFNPFIKQSGAYPLVWSTHLMAPEAYTLEWALDGWVIGETPQQIRTRAVNAYNHYQKCGLTGAGNLLKTGW